MPRQAFLALVMMLLAFRAVTSTWNNSEAQEAKEKMDTLSKKLHNDIKAFKETIEEAKENITRIVDRLVIVKKVQVLLAKLNNQPVPGKMCEHRYIVPDFLFKQVIFIETTSALPSRYTASLKGEGPVCVTYLHKITSSHSNRVCSKKVLC